MATHTQSTSGGTAPTSPVIEGGTEVYDRIMGQIEPDLTSKNIKTLDVKYAEESMQEKAKRMERYKKAFAAYLEAYEAHQAQQTSDVRSYGRKLTASIENKSATKDDLHMNDLESAISLA